MACNFYEGIALACNDGISGVQAIWITEFNSVTSTTVTSGSITALTQAAGTKFWYIDSHSENISFAQSTTGTQTTPYSTTQTCTFTVNVHTAKLRNWINTVRQNKFMVLIKDGNDRYQMMGATRGAYASQIDSTTGKMLADFSGSTFTFTAKEPFEAYYVDSSVVSGLSTGT